MKSRSERKVFREICSLSHDEIIGIFDVEDDGTCFSFLEKKNRHHYVSVEKKKEESFWVPINADFGFQRPAGCNNYKELYRVAKHLMDAFGISVSWMDILVSECER